MEHTFCNLEGEDKFLSDITQWLGEAFSNDSFSSDKVTFGFILGFLGSSTDQNHIGLKEYSINGHNAVPGHHDEGSSYRGELAGILVVLVITNDLCQHRGIMVGKFTIWCDNLGATQASTSHQHPMPRLVCYDLLSMIQFQLQSSCIKWSFWHVNSHQDESAPFAE